MKKAILLFCLFVTVVSFSQEEEKAKQKAARISNNFVYEANDKLEGKEFIDAEVSYRKAIAKNDENAIAKYNLGNAYYKENSLEEAFSRFKQAGEVTLSKEQKHKAFHNMGNVFMKNKEFEKAVEAYKEALRNDPTDDETRYNLALAKQKKEQEGGGGDNNKDQDQQDKKDQDKKEGDNGDKDQKGDQKEDKKDEGKDGEDDKKEGDKKDSEDDKKGDKKEDKKDENKGGDQPKDEKGKPKPRPNQLSPQQVKNLLEAMNNAEKKVQEKLNAKKVKGVPVKNEKDW